MLIYSTDLLNHIPDAKAHDQVHGMWKTTKKKPPSFPMQPQISMDIPPTVILATPALAHSCICIIFQYLMHVESNLLSLYHPNYIPTSSNSTTSRAMDVIIMVPDLMAHSNLMKQ